MSKEETQRTRDREALLHLYHKTLPRLGAAMQENLAEIKPLFHDFHLERVVDTWTRSPEASAGEEISLENGNVRQMLLRVRLEGFHCAGAPPFDVTKELHFQLKRSVYEVGSDKENAWVEKRYGQPWAESEIREVAQRWSGELIDEVAQRMERLIYGIPPFT